MIKDYGHQSKCSWNLEVLFIWLPQDILQELTKINLANGDAQTDQLHWSPSEKGQFTTTKGYLGLLNFGDEGNGHKRKQIWNFKGPSRASMLLWFIKHDRILTKSLLMQWNVSDMACCTLCERKEETALHATRDYSQVRGIQQMLVHPALMVAFYSLTECSRWVDENLHSDWGTDIEKGEWKYIFREIVYRIWRNRFLFGVQEEDIPRDIFIQQIRQRVLELLAVHTL